MIIGFFFFSHTKILSNLFYAIKDAKTPLKASVAGALSSIIFSVILGLTLGFKGLALAMSISGLVNMAALVVFINKKIGSLRVRMFFNLDTLYLLAILVTFSVIIKSTTINYILCLIASSIVYAFSSYFFYKRLHLE